MGKNYELPDNHSFLAEEDIVPYLSHSSVPLYSFWDDLSILREISLKGLGSNFFTSLKKRFRLNNQQFTSLVGVTWKTITNHREDHQIVGMHTERALYIAKVWDAGIDYFNDPTQLRKWLSFSNPFFNDEIPLNLLNTISGCEIVYSKLRQMAFGISA